MTRASLPVRFLARMQAGEATMTAHDRADRLGVSRHVSPQHTSIPVVAALPPHTSRADSRSYTN